MVLQCHPGTKPGQNQHPRVCEETCPSPYPLRTAFLGMRPPQHRAYPLQTTLSPCGPQIEYISGGTPLTNQHYIASPRGQIYGIEHSPANLQAEALATMRAQTAIPNLYLTGTMATAWAPWSQRRPPLGEQQTGEEKPSKKRGD